MSYRLLQGDVLHRLRELPADSVHCVVTSPPYWGLRDYGVDGQIGLEATPEEFIAKLVEVFREVRRVLRPNGTCWVNMGDAYAGSWGAQGHLVDGQIVTRASIGWDRAKAAALRKTSKTGSKERTPGLKPKDLIGQPWRLAFALQADGWYLRQDIIWAKPNPMPESVTDRCTKAHEYLFLLTKSERYFYDADAIKEASVWALPEGGGSGVGFGRGYDVVEKPRYSSGNKSRKTGLERGCPEGSGANVCGSVPWEGNTRNKRSVWTIATEAFPEAHFATFPTELVKPCILAGSPLGGTVLDPFNGSGTTGVVAQRLGREYIGIELNPAYVEMARRRLDNYHLPSLPRSAKGDHPLFAEEEAGAA